MRTTLLKSYLIRFIRKDRKLTVYLQNLRTGEKLIFETWAAAWVFLEQEIEEDKAI